MHKEYSTVTSKGQLVIPASLRRRLKIEEGTRVLFVEDNGRLILEPLTQDSIARARGCLPAKPSLLQALLEDRRREREREQ